MLIGKAKGATGWGMFGYIFGGAVIGGIAGQVGASLYTTGMAFGTAAGYGGFVAGFHAGMISGLAAGAINGFGMAMLSGSSFDNIMASMSMGAWVGGVMGGITGGLTEGIRAKRAGYSFGKGVRYDEFSLSPDAITDQAKQRAIKYNKSSGATMNDEMLIDFMKEDFNVSVGDYGIQSMSTKPHLEKYGLTGSGNFLDLESGATVGGYVRHVYGAKVCDLRISMNVVNSKDFIFRAVAGHELIHAYHINILGASYNSIISDGYAYRYSHDVYFNAGQFQRSMNTMSYAMKSGYWLQYNKNYTLPFFLKIW